MTICQLVTASVYANCGPLRAVNNADYGELDENGDNQQLLHAALTPTHSNRPRIPSPPFVARDLPGSNFSEDIVVEWLCPGNSGRIT